MEMEAERREIRKLRKKLRQIEQLERLDRVLSDEEKEKVTKKFEIREKLSKLLKEVEDAGISLNESGFSGTSLTSTPQSMSHSVMMDSVEDTVQMDSLLIDHSSDTHQCENKDINGGSFPSIELDASKSQKHEHLCEKLVDKSNEDGTITSKKRKRAQSRRDKETNVASKWLDRKFVVTSLKGHNDVICSIDVNEKLIMTGSRDTTVKIWDIHTLEETRNLGGHKSAVTSVRILPQAASDDAGTVGISGSLDSYIIVWDLDEEGGKIDVWNIADGTQLKTLRRPGKPVTCVFLGDGKLYCGDTSGTIEVWSIASGDLEMRWNASTRRASDEDEDDADHEDDVSPFSSRCVRCLCYHGNGIYWGDDGTNLKCLQVMPSTDAVSSKLTNHAKEFGSTGAVTVCEREGVLLSSQYDLDNGQAAINVRSLATQAYVCSIVGEGVPYISCMVVTTHTGSTSEQETRLVTGGHELRVWDCYPQHNLPRLKRSLDQSIMSCECFDALKLLYVTDTESENEGEGEEGEEEEVMVSLHTQPLPQARPSEDIIPQQQQSWFWWLCNIL